MSRCQMAHQTDTPQFYPLTVRNVTIRSYRLVCEVVTPMKVSFALHHQLSIKFAGDNRRTGSALEFSKPTAVVEMSVTVQQDLHILQLETKLLDIGFDLWQTLNVTRVQKNVALRGDNQKRTDQIGADVPRGVRRLPGRETWQQTPGASTASSGHSQQM